jgi:Zn-dependent peptidase ImmA (M78 family)
MRENIAINVQKAKISPSGETASVLSALRTLLPGRKIFLNEALRIAERQAERLLRLRDVTALPVPTKIVTGLPRIRLEADADLPRHAASGVSNWNARRRSWIISVNPDEPATRQRLTVLHEYKHIIDHYHPGLGGRLPRTIYGLTPVEYIAEYFAGCVLMPGRTVKTAFYDGIQRPHELAELFDVSPRAIEVRLSQLGLADSPATTQPAPHAPRYRLQPRARRYYRPLSLHWTAEHAREEVAA